MNNELINKYVKGDATAAEKEQIIAWMLENPENEQQVGDLFRLNAMDIWQSDALFAEPTVPVAKVGKRNYRLYAWNAVRIAAMLVLCFLVGKYEYAERRRMQYAGLQEIRVPEGQRVNLVLADGTKVFLNSNTTLRYPGNGFSDQERRVILDGEGYFDVSHAADHPFVVQTSKYDIQVLGTEFNVYAYASSDLFETSLIRGKVRLSESGSDRTLELNPHEMARLERGALQKRHFDDNNLFLWRDGIYFFDDETLGSVFHKLRQYYEVEIVCHNPRILNHHCTAKFRQKEGIEHVIKVLQKHIRFDYSRDEENNRIMIR